MKHITAHQWSVLSGVILLGPALRLLPRLPAQYAARSCWLAALIALPLLLLYALLLSRLWENRPEGTGFAELTVQILGPAAARPVLVLFAAWFLFYGGFLLRAGGDRLVVTIYPHSSSTPFVLSMGLVCLFAALGSARSLARTAKLVRPLIYGVLLLLLLTSLRGVDRGNLLPVTIYDLPALTRAARPVLDVLGLGLFLPLFFLGYVRQGGARLPRCVRWLFGQTALLTLLMLAVVGNFSAALVTELTHPFFTLVRNLVFFRSLERLEALVVSCWIFPDFLLVSLCLYAAQLCLRTALGEQPLQDGSAHLRFDRRRWLIPLCGAVCILIGLLLAPDLMSLRRLSESVVPGINLAVCYLSPPLLLLAEKLPTLLKNKPPQLFWRRLAPKKRGEQ